MRLEYAGISKEIIKSGIDLEKISDTVRARHINNIYNRKSSKMLDWIDLPNMSEEEISKIDTLGKMITKKYKNFVVLGIGGSALGIKMLKNTFVDSLNRDIGINVYVCDNIDSDSFVTLLDSIDLKKTMFNVITKSGSTSETLAQMNIVMARMKRKKIDIASHFVVTTTEGNGLDNFAKVNNIPTLYIAEGVGGRYSVLSPVGLLPASVMGLDIRELLFGARKSLDNSKLCSIKNIAYTTAYINCAYLKKEMTNLVVMPYSDRLALLPEFFAQLWAESLGKKFNKKGEEVFAGQTPIKSLGVTDQHSQLQLYSEGIKDKVIMFMTVEKNCYDETIEDSGFASHLAGSTLKSLLDYEYTATAYSLTLEDRPNYTIAISHITEQTIGEVIFFMEMATAFAGEMLGIDAFDQPGVEQSKVFTRACLGVKGYEDKAKEIKNYKKVLTKLSL